MNFEHSRFNNSIKAGYVARDIVAAADRGSATSEKIVTVLNSIHEIEHISNLNRINDETINRYSDYLKTAYDNKELVAHTAQGYVSALNAVINYINLRTDKNLLQISTFKDLGIKNEIVYGGKSTPEGLYRKVYEKLSEPQRIKLELQRSLFLRVRESHFIKKDTIENALKTGVLKLNQFNNDGTKNSRQRDVKIRTENQKNSLIQALNFMERTGQKSLIENNKTYRQAVSKYNRDMRLAGGTRKNNAGNNFSHGNRHFGLNNLANNILPLLPSENKDIDKIVSMEAGHGADRTTDIYLGKH